MCLLILLLLRSTHWNARESQSRGLARGQIQRRAVSSHRTYQVIWWCLRLYCIFFCLKMVNAGQCVRVTCFELRYELYQSSPESKRKRHNFTTSYFHILVNAMHFCASLTFLLFPFFFSPINHHHYRATVQRQHMRPRWMQVHGTTK